MQDQQARLIEKLVPAVDEYRHRIQMISERRDLLMAQMERMDDSHKHEVLGDLEDNLRLLLHSNRQGLDAMMMKATKHGKEGGEDDR